MPAMALLRYTFFLPFKKWHMNDSDIILFFGYNLESTHFIAQIKHPQIPKLYPLTGSIIFLMT